MNKNLPKDEVRNSAENDVAGPTGTSLLAKQNQDYQNIKQFSKQQLQELSNEIRELIKEKVREFGGHYGPDLGIVEVTVGLHRVFELPSDKIVWDVAHQVYPHKLLTGRLKEFQKGGSNPFLGGFSGYTSPQESKFDFFTTGHTSTSIALGLGLSFHNQENKTIVVIGDGSLTGGEAFEGLNNLRNYGGNILVVVNDNEWSIAKNNNGLSHHLDELRKTKGQAENNFFKALGLEYFYLESGNDVSKVVQTLEKIKDIKSPTILHVHTIKGLGDEEALERPNYHHYIGGKISSDKKNYPVIGTFQTLDKFLFDKLEKEPNTVVLDAAANIVSDRYIKKFPNQFLDTGIAEQCATSFTASYNSRNFYVSPEKSPNEYSAQANKYQAWLLIWSNFIRRAVDQLSEDVSLNQSPSKILIGGAGVNDGSATHNSNDDIQIIGNLPGITYLDPINEAEFQLMLEYVNTFTKPVMLRFCQNNYFSDFELPEIELNPLEFAKSQTLVEGSEIAIIALGVMMPLAFEVAEALKKQGINPSIINPRFITPIDQDLSKLAQKHAKIITLENGNLEGGFGAKINNLFSDLDTKVYNFGTQGILNYLSIDEIIEKFGLSPEAIAKKVLG